MVASALLFSLGRGKNALRGTTPSFRQHNTAFSLTFYSSTLLPSNGLAPGLAALICEGLTARTGSAAVLLRSTSPTTYLHTPATITAPLPTFDTIYTHYTHLKGEHILAKPIPTYNYPRNFAGGHTKALQTSNPLLPFLLL